MPFEDLPSRLEDILDAITDVTQFIAGRSFDEYQRDKLLRLAIERCIEIISKASRHIPPDMKARHAAVPWQKVADIGNVLRHAYQSVDPQIMWEVATRHVSVLHDAVEHMLNEIGPDDD
jgi:uncharacterized protein with HEPN domain